MRNTWICLWGIHPNNNFDGEKWNIESWCTMVDIPSCFRVLRSYPSIFHLSIADDSGWAPAWNIHKLTIKTSRVNTIFTSLVYSNTHPYILHIYTNIDLYSNQTWWKPRFNTSYSYGKSTSNPLSNPDVSPTLCRVSAEWHLCVARPERIPRNRRPWFSPLGSMGSLGFL